MKVKIYLRSKSGRELPYYYRNILVGYMNRLIDNSIIHDSIGLYNLSNIYGTRLNMLSLSYSFIGDEVYFIFSSPVDSICFDVLKGINTSRDINNDLVVTRGELVADRYEFDGIKTIKFNAMSPIVINNDRYEIKDGERVLINTNKRFMRYDNENASLKLKRIILSKYDLMVKEYGIDEIDISDFDIRFDLDYKLPKFKHYSLTEKKKLMGSICPVYITGSMGIINFCNEIGLGNYTKLGYGRI